MYNVSETSSSNNSEMIDLKLYVASNSQKFDFNFEIYVF